MYNINIFIDKNIISETMHRLSMTTIAPYVLLLYSLVFYCIVYRRKKFGASEVTERLCYGTNADDYCTKPKNLKLSRLFCSE